MSILCQEILRRHSMRRSHEMAEKRKHLLIDFVEWAGVLTLVAFMLGDHQRATGVLRLLLSLVQR